MITVNIVMMNFDLYPLISRARRALSYGHVAAIGADTAANDSARHALWRKGIQRFGNAD